MWKIALGLLFYLILSNVQAHEYRIFELMNQRMVLMKDVAASKAVKHQAIEDLQQEQNVLIANLAQASRLGIEPESIEPFIQAQMDIAKAIQYRYRADWLASPESNWQAQDLDTVRQNISHISSDLIETIAQELLKHGDLHLSDHNLDLSQLHHPQISFADKRRLLETLAQIRLKPVRSRLAR